VHTTPTNQEARSVTWSKFHTEDPHILGVTEKKFIVARATWPPGFVHLWCKSPASFSSRGKAARKGGHLPSF